MPKTTFGKGVWPNGPLRDNCHCIWQLLIMHQSFVTMAPMGPEIAGGGGGLSAMLWAQKKTKLFCSCQKIMQKSCAKACFCEALMESCASFSHGMGRNQNRKLDCLRFYAHYNGYFLDYKYHIFLKYCENTLKLDRVRARIFFFRHHFRQFDFLCANFFKSGPFIATFSQVILIQWWK